MIIQNALLEHFSADRQRLHPGAIETESIRINDQISIGWFPLLTFAVAVALLIGLQLLIRYTRLGRALRATSDDQRTAQLVGIDNRRLYAIAMAMSMGTAAIAGVFLGAYTSFDPSSGPARLIFGFEAVIIGGLGSLWGTLLGGMVLGIAQALGAEISIGWGEFMGHLVFLAILIVRPQGSSRDRGRRDDGRHDVRDRRGRAAHVDERRDGDRPLRCPRCAHHRSVVGERGRQRDLVELFTLLALAQMWNLLAGYAGLVSIGQQAFIGIGAYGLLLLGDRADVHPFAAVALAGLAAAAISIPVAALVFRLRGGYFAIGTWVIAEVFALLTLNGVISASTSGAATARRSCPQPGSSAPFVLTAPTGGRWASGPGRCWSSTPSCARASASRSRRSGTTRPPPAALASTSCARRCSSGRSLRSAAAWSAQ